jgi:hypothetical protein
MILPTKGIPPQKALVSLGAEVLRLLTETKTVSRLWDDFRKSKEQGGEVTFDWFVLSLDLLFTLGIVEFEREGAQRTARRQEPRGNR